MYSSRSKATSETPPLEISTTWPATSPSDPIALPNSEITLKTLSAKIPFVDVAICSNANANRASPARTAISSPKTLWLVGFPLLRSSLSIQGKSS
eukprot:Gb_08532 [translate_table: standard]